MDTIEKVRPPTEAENESAAVLRKPKREEPSRLEQLRAKLEAASPDRAMPKVHSETCVY
jgi:hypothetical protein